MSFYVHLQQNGKEMAMAVNPTNMQLVVEELTDESRPSQEWTIEELYLSSECGYKGKYANMSWFECFNAQIGAAELPTSKTFALQNTGNGIMASVGEGKPEQLFKKSPIP